MVVSLAARLSEIQSKLGTAFIRIIERNRSTIFSISGSNYLLINYDVYYHDSSLAVNAYGIGIAVKNIDTIDEDASYYGSVPTWISGGTPFSVSLDSLITSILSSNKLIKRILVLELYDSSSCAVVAAYIADATLPTKITKTLYFVYDDSGTMRYYPYASGTI